MSLTPGARLGAYEVVARIGAGGMGEVYRARDTKLHRDVALKILPEAFASDPDRLARFQREARVLASLNHPNIGGIHGLEESDGLNALVLEFVEGETLADRIARGPIPVDEALPIAKQVSEALEAAHEHGIIHRDLKPANIKLRPDGTVKVLDFGLAKALDSRPGANDLLDSPTITSPAITGMSVILGTAAYMSPEQARGHAADRRSDMWAFGCVLYEMLTARRAFPGADVSDTLATVIKSDPSWNVLPSDLPPAIRRLLRRCLEKDPKLRLRDAGTANVEIREAQIAPTAETIGSPGTLQLTWRRLMPVFLGALLVGGILTGLAVWSLMRPSPPHVVRFTIAPSSTSTLSVSGTDRDLAITPDGTRIVYAGPSGSALLVRALDQLDATQLTGLGAPHGPFVSPDGQWIGFADGTLGLKKVAITGGPSVPIVRFDGVARGATWGADDTVVFATSSLESGLQAVPATGGEPAVVTRPNRGAGESDHLWPEFLPDGQAVLFTITATTGGLDAASVAVLDRRSGTQSILIRGGSHAHYAQSGHLVYSVAGTLRAVPFDLSRLAVVGQPVPVVWPVVTTPFGAVDAVVANDGTLVYVRGSGAANERTLVWVDRQGREEPIAAPRRAYVYPRLSPDGTRIALYLLEQENDIWLWNMARATLARVTFDSGIDNYPAWTPDGRRLFFSSDRGSRNLFGQLADGTGSIDQLTESPNVKNPTSVSPDGTRLVFTEIASKTGEDVMMLLLSGERRVTPLVQTPFAERNGVVSPDGRWLAYEANDSGQFEIYVRPFPDVTSGRWQVSTGGGTRPLWARSGEELFYMRPGVALMRVGVQKDPAFPVTAPVRLFEGRYFASAAVSLGRTYDISPDGQRFLMIKEGAGSNETAEPTIVVVQHWDQELKRLVPTK